MIELSFRIDDDLTQQELTQMKIWRNQMIELRFRVDDDLTQQELIQIAHWRDYNYAIYETKRMLFEILDNGSWHGIKVDLDDKTTEVVEFIQRKFLENCEDLPRGY